MIRFVRLTLPRWYVGVLAGVLCVIGPSFYLYVAASLLRDVDRALMLQADGVAETIFAYWRAERSAAGSGPGNWLTAPSNSFEGEITQEGLPALLSRWAEKTGNLDTERPVRLLDKNGQVLGASPSFTALTIPMTDIQSAGARELHTVYQTFRLPDRRVRVITRPIIAQRRPLYFVQIAASLQERAVTLARLRLWLLILIPSMLALARLVGWFLAIKAEASVRKSLAQAHQFMATHLHERLELPRTGDELQQLDTTLNQLFLRLDRTLRKLRQFSAAASHELRTPLTVMKGEIGVALRKPRPVEEYRRVLRTQLEAIDDLEGTVEELLRMAQTEAAEGEGEWHPIELGALVRQTCEVFKTIAKTKAIQLQLAVDAPLWVRGDQRLCQRLLSNLLENALKYTPAQGHVLVETSLRGDEAHLTVQDTGAGIRPDQLPQLFEQFFNRRPAANGTASTGLGLGLCRWIAESHHGHLDVSSRPGQGATFTVRLPICAPPA